jgi:dedicated sortase system histidine kinase
MKMPSYAVGLRPKLALVSLCLMALPWVGYLYVREMEHVLLQGLEQTLVGTARAVATALHERPLLMRLPVEDDNALRRQAEEELRQLAGTRQSTARGDMPHTSADGQGQAHDVAADAPDVRQSGPISGEDAEQSEEILAILRGLGRSSSRIWVVNRNYRVLALSGGLKPKQSEPDSPIEGMEWLSRRVLRPVLTHLIRTPHEDFDDSISDDMLATSIEIENTLRGAPNIRWRNTPDGLASVISATHPIWSENDVVGAVIVEETTNPILSLRTRATERLLVLTLIVFALGAAIVLWFATRLSNRIRRLRDEAESAVDAEGRIRHLVSGSGAADEIGDLSRSFSTVLDKLGQYNAYLQNMASRLSHEFRTPIAVVRSSLENLKLQPLPDDSRVYIERADEGVTRLNAILTRMSEATRLEQSLATVERERFDLAAVVAGCVTGYRHAYPDNHFELRLPTTPVHVIGSPDLAAQMLDKLIENAVDFSPAEAPIELSVRPEGTEAVLRVANEGPLLPADLRGRLFDSMVSLRKDGTAKGPHLGLGLHIVRLIADFHGGSAAADNRADGRGVELAVRMPTA